MTRKYGLLVALAGICLVTATAANAATVEFRLLINGTDVETYTGGAGAVTVSVQARTDGFFGNYGGVDYYVGVTNFQVDMLDSTGISGSVLSPVELLGPPPMSLPTGTWNSTFPVGFSTTYKGQINKDVSGVLYDVIGQVGNVGDKTTYGFTYGGGADDGTGHGPWATITEGSFNYDGGTATLTLVPVLSAVNVLNSSGTGSAPATAVVGDSVLFGEGGAAPTIVIDTANVGEGDWTQEPGWLNDLHQVAINATITDGPADVEWTLTNPNTGHSDVLGVTAEDFTLTMAMIKGLGTVGGEVPLAGGISGYDYNWVLQASVDGGNSTDSITVFIPEPTTMGLLGFGIVGALLRRRRA